MKESKGITLIALVITIIVLLILAGASISMVIGNDGIISKANKAKEDVNTAGAIEAVELEVINSLDNYGAYNKDLAKSNIENNLNTPQAIVTDNGDGTLSVEYKDKDLIIDIAGNVSLDNSKAPIATNKSFVGCYADFENESGERIPDGKPDGIIFADKAVGNTNGSEWTCLYSEYTITKVESGLKKYYVRPEKVVDERWSTEPKDVVSLKSTSGEDRFYVMSLEDLSDKSYNWYSNAYNETNGLMKDYLAYTSKDFGAGKENTRKMIARGEVEDGSIPGSNGDTPYGKISSDDVWALDLVKNKFAKGWFVPSSQEWAGFANELKLGQENYASYKLAESYWSSSQDNEKEACFIGFEPNSISSDYIYKIGTVRLATTF